MRGENLREVRDFIFSKPVCLSLIPFTKSALHWTRMDSRLTSVELHVELGSQKKVTEHYMGVCDALLRYISS